MLEPRSLATNAGTWLTDSRVYNLIWLGRWLERTEAISRAVNSAARQASAGGDGTNSLGDALAPVANVAGISVGDTDSLAGEILLEHPASSALHCLSNARMNATQVAPVELIRAIGAAILDLEEIDAASLDTPDRVIEVTDGIAAHLANIHEAIEDRWFGRESLTEEEVFHRFVQQ